MSRLLVLCVVDLMVEERWLWRSHDSLGFGSAASLEVLPVVAKSPCVPITWLNAEDDRSLRRVAVVVVMDDQWAAEEGPAEGRGGVP